MEIFNIKLREASVGKVWMIDFVQLSDFCFVHIATIKTHYVIAMKPQYPHRQEGLRGKPTDNRDLPSM